MLLPAQFKETGIFVYMYPEFYNLKDVILLKEAIRQFLEMNNLMTNEIGL